VNNTHHSFRSVAEVLKTVFVGVLLVIAFGCAPRKIAVYEGEPTISPRADMIEYAVSLLGKPYRNGAKGPAAFDCSGFVHFVYGRFNTVVPVSTDKLVNFGYEVSRDQVEPGDMVFFVIKGEMHVGIMINPFEFIHSSTSRGVAIDSLDFPYWRRGISQFRRIL
jgi:cell wall-associated NlpC family hydrolase